MDWFTLVGVLIQVFSALIVSVGLVGGACWLIVAGILKLVEESRRV